MSELKALGVSAKNNKDLYNRDGPDASLLECFDKPKGKGTMVIEITAPEFSSLCPITNQPDFATIVVSYEPGEKCLESKSWKLYINSYRNHGSFHEAIVAQMCNDLVKLLDPVWLEVEGQFTPRGGIKFWPTARYYAEE